MLDSTLVTVKCPSAFAGVTATLLILLPALALLQYRGVTGVNDAEEARLDRARHAAAESFRDAFDGEIARAIIALRADVATLRATTPQPYADRFAAWMATTRYAGVLASVLLIDGSEGGLRVRQWNRSASAFEEVPWSDRLAPWKPRLLHAITMWRTTGQSMATTIRPDDPSLFFAPILGGRPASAVDRTAAEILGFTVIELNWPYVQRELLPALARRHFAATDGFEYEIAIVHGREGRETLFATSSAAARLPGALEVELLHPALRDPLSLFPQWILRVQYASGSTEAALAALHRRNLTLSVGVLSLLGTSVVFLAVSVRRAQRLARQQIDFVAGVSHELRSPLAVIRSAAENLSHGIVSSSAPVRDYGQLIEKETQRLGDMIERVLQYANVASPRVGADRTKVAVADLVQSAAVAASQERPDVTVERLIEGDIPFVMGDAAALQCALQNLVANALKYGDARGWVGITAGYVAGSRPEVRITVEDRGRGIPDDDLPHIFEPFYRGSNARASRAPGNGLGLSLVRQIVAAHGGTVSVSTRRDAGTSFTIRLPAMGQA